ncbi:MAG TPA: hypothetical protein VMA36_08880 [Candidatus Limnocylindria bacterium]|nr:hypothetical protein [Candidatus Limnocylindria bacterium]
MTRRAALRIGREGVADSLAPDGSAALPAIAFLVDLQNGSGTTLTLQTATLTAGLWLPPAPQIADQILPGAMPRYVNAPAQSFSGLGGSLIFVPMTGGSITIGWTWPSGQAPQAGAYGQNTSLIVRGQLINAGTGQPNFQVQVSTK